MKVVDLFAINPNIILLLRCKLSEARGAAAQVLTGVPLMDQKAATLNSPSSRTYQ